LGVFELENLINTKISSTNVIPPTRT